MKIQHCSTGTEIDVIVEPVTAEDLGKLTRKRYFFDWKKAFNGTTLYKLRIKDHEDIKGVMALVDYPDEMRIQIEILAVSAENVILKKDKGKKQKEYENIAGNLIAWAGRQAIKKYGAVACVSLKPKTLLKKHYMTAYGMSDGGTQVFPEGPNLIKLITDHNL